ncbi:Chromatin modification-related EAF7 [Lecanosticta acicola]|uniref:Chromatin modification-related EAF7 n=1 Tax=Lecanosticta acicola TaxID=111012 RepID=A0AAI8Z797_9PEZI|nr:Chromatin modification-related EAF7 [Lecanosticta acicola]
MPPKKKARASPEPQAAKTPTPTSTAASPDEAALNDPWTDDEEIGLFKGLMRWKPTGIHKHFRLMCLHAWLLENNHIHPRNEHTKPAGIWRKLSQMYDLPALDAREDARQLSPLRTGGEQDEMDEDKGNALDDDIYSVAANKIGTDEFELPPDNGFEEEMWERRLPKKPDEEIDAELVEINMAAEAPIRFTPSFSIEPSEAATPSSKAVKSKRGKGGRAGVATAPRRSTRKTESVADKEEENDEEDRDGEEEKEEDGEDEDEEESGEEEEEASQASTPGPKGKRTSKATTRSKTASKSKGRSRKGR